MEAPTKEKQLELAIRSAQDFRELYRIIQENGGVQGNQKLYTAGELFPLIGRVSKGENPNLVTSSFGLRAKVLELAKMEQLRNELAEDPKFKLKKLLDNINLNIGHYQFESRRQGQSLEQLAEHKTKIADLEKRKADVLAQIGSTN